MAIDDEKEATTDGQFTNHLSLSARKAIRWSCVWVVIHGSNRGLARLAGYVALGFVFFFFFPVEKPADWCTVQRQTEVVAGAFIY